MRERWLAPLLAWCDAHRRLPTVRECREVVGQKAAPRSIYRARHELVAALVERDDGGWSLTREEGKAIVAEWRAIGRRMRASRATRATVPGQAQDAARASCSSFPLEPPTMIVEVLPTGGDVPPRMGVVPCHACGDPASLVPDKATGLTVAACGGCGRREPLSPCCSGRVTFTHRDRLPPGWLCGACGSELRGWDAAREVLAVSLTRV